MPRSVVLIACLLAIAAALSTWFWWPRDVAVPNYREADHPNASSNDETSGNTVGGTSRTSAGANAGIVTPGNHRKLKVQLHGLHRDAPWTSDIQIQVADRGRNRVFGEFEGSAAVQKDGRCDLPLPAWWQPGIRIKLRIQGRNDGYRELTHRKTGNMQFTDVLMLDVRPIAELNGKVTDRRGKPVASARVTAFAMRVGQPFGKAVGSTSSNASGVYQLHAPPDIPLMIIATAMQPSVMRWRGATGITDNGQLRGDLLPANLPVQLAVNHPGTECNFALADAARITGIVQWPDLEPVRGARVQHAGQEGNKLELGPNAEIHWQGNGSMVVSGIANVDRDGRFTIPSTPGATVNLRVVAADETLIVGELLQYSVVAPIEQTITVPFPVTLRAIHQGQMIPYARMLMHGMPPHRTGADGTLRALITNTAMVRAERGALRSPWQPVCSSQLQQTIDFDMANELSALHVEFEGKFPVRNAAFHWKCDDGRQLTERLHRGDTGGPFEIWLEPGRYELNISAAVGERNGTFLLPVTRKFDIRHNNDGVPARRLDVPAQFGGKFVLQVLDQNSQYLAGKILVRDPQGKEFQVPMSVDGEPGTFAAELSTCQQNLAPGPYELVIDLGAHGVHKRYVTIKERESSPVSLRL